MINYKDFLKTPNLITLTRILLLPVFIWMYFSVGSTPAFFLVAVIAMTDVVDGYIARKYNMVTELGQLLDPIADKLIQLSVVFCLAIDEVIPIWFLVIVLVKEVSMVIGGAVLYKKIEVINQAKWFGKLATFAFYLVAGAAFFIGKTHPTVTFWLVCVLTFILIFAFIRYLIMYIKFFKNKSNETDGKNI